jgi:hypothetical protein
MPSKLKNGPGGRWWNNGVLVSDKYCDIPPEVFFINIERLIKQNQEKAFELYRQSIKKWNGSTFSLPLIPNNNFFSGSVTNVNGPAVFIEYEEDENAPNNYLEQRCRFFIRAVTSPNENLNAANKTALRYLKAFKSIFRSMNEYELVWREQEEGESEEDFYVWLSEQPNITVSSRISEKDQNYVGLENNPGVQFMLTLNIKATVKQS